MNYKTMVALQKVASQLRKTAGFWGYMKDSLINAPQDIAKNIREANSKDQNTMRMRDFNTIKAGKGLYMLNNSVGQFYSPRVETAIKKSKNPVEATHRALKESGVGTDTAVMKKLKREGFTQGITGSEPDPAWVFGNSTTHF